MEDRRKLLMQTWIAGGRIVDPTAERLQDLDLLIEGGRIAGLFPSGRMLPGSDVEKIDGSGLWILPGPIDMHVHLREPGYEHKETISSGARAAASGGFVGVACMANTDPVNDRASVTRLILEKAQKAGLVKVFPVAAITRGLKGKTVTDFRTLREAGAVAVSDDGRPVEDPEVMRRVLISAAEEGLAVISHCEALALSRGGVMHEGSVSAQLGYRGIPASAEEEMVMREISLSRSTGCPVHIAHVSTAGSIRLIRQAKEDNVPVTAETAPHYFTLDHTAILRHGTNAKMNPPLRTPEDVQAVKEALSEDVIDVIATDHAPHAAWEKECEFEQAPFGIIGLETALPLVLDLVRQGYLTPSQAARKLSSAPAAILGLDGGRLEPGGKADLIVVDPDREYALREEDIQSKSRNSPFLGSPLRGMNLLTMVGGRIVWKR
jgi:dihydroorotase